MEKWSILKKRMVIWGVLCIQELPSSPAKKCTYLFIIESCASESAMVAYLYLFYAGLSLCESIVQKNVGHDRDTDSDQ